MNRLRYAVLAVVLIGCSGDSSRGKLVAVTGTVTLDSQPLANAIVTFTPAGETKGQGAFGRTDAAGQYSLTTPRGEKGVLPGEYKVTVSKLVDPKTGADATLDPTKPPIEQAEVRELLPPQYSNPTLTTIAKTVPPSGGAIDLPLKKK